MSHLPAGVAAFMAMSGLAGPVIVYANCLTRKQRRMAYIMATVAVVRTNVPYVVIWTADLKEFINRIAA